MRTFREMANDSPKVPDYAREAIENRTGHPKSLLRKVEEKINEHR